MMEHELKICRSKQAAYMVGLIGISLLIFGLLFLYLNFISSYAFYRNVAIASFGIASFAIYTSLNFSKKPLIVASEQGIQINASLIGKSTMLPWEGIQNLAVERRDPVATYGALYGLPYTKCLVIEINNEYQNKLPRILKGVTQKFGNKLYFSSLSLSADDAHEQLSALKNKKFNCFYDSKFKPVVKKQKLADLLLLLLLIGSGLLAVWTVNLIVKYPTPLGDYLISLGDEALFCIPFFLYAGISALIFFAVLKGKMQDE